MAHRSRLGGISIDCRTEDLDGAAGFWAAVFGSAVEPEGETYVKLAPQRGVSVEVQKVAHESRVHIDIETDDVAAEVARLEALGAVRVEAVKDWVVMAAPTGQRFCVVPAAGEMTEAARWE